ncbi:MAG: mandelate racemase/muconate lactonizing enzyme family protein [Pseudomonadota bacterium]
MKIETVESVPFTPAFTGDGFTVSYGHLVRLDHRLVRLVAEDGRIGVGELMRQPAVDSSTAAALENRVLPTLIGRDLADLPSFIDRLRAEGRLAHGLCFGLETAWADLTGRAADLPVSALMGGPGAGDVPEMLGLSCRAPKAVADEIRARASDVAHVQIKLGIGAIAEDLARIRAALEALAPDQTLYADFNGVLPLELALAELPQIRDRRLVWEEPCATLDDNLTFARAAGAPVLFDQCVDTPETLYRALSSGVPAAVAIKPFYLGGLSLARAARDMATAAGMPFRIDGPWCGQVAAAAALHVALGADRELLLFSSDLTDPLETERKLIAHPAKARVGPAPGPGLGSDTARIFAEAA